MIAKDRGRALRFLGFVVVVIGVTCSVLAQQVADPRFPVPPPAPQSAAPPSKAKAKTKIHLSQINVPGVQQVAIPVNPNDAIAVVNGQHITRQQLADECVARKGKEILDLLVNRTLIEQALRSNKLEVTAAEIDQEIEN